MEAVLNGPVGASKRHDPLGAGLTGRQAGDEIDDLDTLLSAHEAAALQPCDLRQPRPAGIAHRFCRKCESPRLDATVAAFDRLGLALVRRRLG
jgi:hypothetical protein